MTRIAALVAIVLASFMSGYLAHTCPPPVNCCADVHAQLTQITKCDNFVIVDNEGCGPCTDYQIAERMGPEQLDCGPYYTEVVGNVTFVTMGEAGEP